MRKLTVLLANGWVPRLAIRGITALGATILMTSASACTAHNNFAQGDVAFVCSVDGEKLLNPAMSSEAVCAEFKSKIDEALARKTVTVNSVSQSVPADWIKLDVRFSKPGTASAMLVLSTGGKETAHPEIAVDVMDKFMGPNDVDTLASAVAKFVAESTKR